MSSRPSASGPAKGSRRLAIGILLVTVLCILGLRHVFKWQGTPWESSILFCFVSMTLTQLMAHSRRPFVSDARPDLRVVVVIAVHNEDPALLGRCLQSLEAQTMLPTKVHLIDDGSSDPAAREAFKAWSSKMTHIIETELTAQVNKGKRHAQANAFIQDGADIFCTVDSDTVLEPRAIEEGVKPFTDPKIQGVAGLIMGINWNKNLLTRVIDLEFTNSFIVGRAAMTSVGSVLVTCGALAFYRAEVVKENIGHYLTETFLGGPVKAGDDRSLSQYSLKKGQVVLQETSIAMTALPERLSHLVRQRLRWNTSFYRGLFWVLRNMPLRKPAYWITLWKAVSFLTFSTMLLITIVIAPTLSGRIAWWYFLYVSILAYVRSLRYLAFQRHDMSLRDQLFSVGLAPFVAMLYFFVLTPVQYLAIFKVRQSKWRTRTQVEVTVEQAKASTDQFVDFTQEQLHAPAREEMFKPDHPSTLDRSHLRLVEVA